MKKLFAMLLVGGLVAATTIGCGPAATTETKPGTTTSSTTTPAATEKTTKGTVVSYEKPKLVVKVGSDEKTFSTTDDTKVTGDLKKDAAVTVTEKDGKVTAVDAK